MNWQDLGYEKLSTEDGLPTLQALGVNPEPMHHSGGALRESRTIYGRAITPTFEILTAPRFLSLGLGLGYNELLIAETAALPNNRKWQCISFEADLKLSECFLDFLKGTLPAGEVRQTYTLILSAFENPEAIRQQLLRAHQEARWILSAELQAQTRLPFLVHTFLWDAFSQHTSPDLWDEAFLIQFLRQHADPDAAQLSTYACLGRLRRALKENGFLVQTHGGFSGKKNSTLGIRGQFLTR